MAEYKIYCDESRQTGFRYMLVGGVWILKKEGWNFVNDFERFCEKDLGMVRPMGHMKWTKVPTSNQDKYYRAYEKLVDLYFCYNKKNLMSFRTLVVDVTQYDFKNEIFYEGDYERGFYNLYCQLILNWLQKDNIYYIRIAKRNITKADKNDCEELRLINLKEKLNSKFERQINKYVYQYGYKYAVNPPVVSIEPRPAKIRRLIQLADILMGAVGFYWNNEHLKKRCAFRETYSR